jgi:DNA helicase II / ATP-dependent DNA helicase PcrA
LAVTLNELLQILNNARGFGLTPEQEAIVNHSSGPAWVLAGPGTGKTEVLTVMLLRLLYVSDDPIQSERINPESVFVTTFTEKAARNLSDRLAMMRTSVIAADTSLGSIDTSKLRINTLHGLCNELLQEFRAPNYQNVRLMDDFEQAMFIHEHMDMVKNSVDARDVPFWTEFEFLFARNVWQARYGNCPRKWAMAKALVKMFNRLVEDRIDISALRAAGGQMQRLADVYVEYNQLLTSNYRCDFSHLQARFLDFLTTPVGRAFLDGNGTENSGIRWVLVDEYQDTNRIQEEIYMTLSDRGDRNLVVVGDDDQAMYRFRGGSVECMVTFDDAVQTFLGLPKTSINTYPLSTNFRSHPDIVDFCDEFITSFPVMAQSGARVPGKPTLNAGGSISGAYPAVAALETQRVGELPGRFADLVKGLIDNGIVSDPNQCCLLLMSTKETPRNAGPYVEALRDAGLTVYNPRNKAFLEQEEIQCLLGAVLNIVDNNQIQVPRIQRGRRTGQLLYPLVQSCWETFQVAAASFPTLRSYVDDVVTAVQNADPGTYLASSLHEMVYLVLGLDPFPNWLMDPARRLRLGRLTKLFEAYSSMPVPNYPDISRGTLRVAQRTAGVLVPGWVRQFYHLFLGYLSDAGMDDVADDEVICPPGMVPVMTMHQSKGLEFPFVFVGHAGAKASPSETHQLEETFDPYPMNPARSFGRAPATERAELDLIRQYFVAYSRPQYALIIMGSRSQIRNNDTIPCGPNRNWLVNRSINI